MRVADGIIHASQRASILGVPQLYVEGNHYGSIAWESNELMDMHIVGAISDLPDITDDAVLEEEEPEAFLVQSKPDPKFPWGLVGWILWFALWAGLISMIR